jgi:hypothetical protein
VAAIVAMAKSLETPRTDLDLNAFGDFEARHALRVHLVQAAADALDPLAPSEPWGYWTAEEIVRTARAIEAAAPHIATDPEPLWLPSRNLATTEGHFTVEELGALPTGDTYVDTAGFPGPRAIGKLEKLSLDDPAHREWLGAEVRTLEALPDAQVPGEVERAAGELGKHPFRSVYYNVKQLRNAAVRVLARRGQYDAARLVLLQNLPLHDQDWACPNREGILLGIEGRLLLAAGSADAEATLDRALAAADTFLAHTTRMEAGGGAQGAPAGPPGPAPGGGPQGGRPSGPPPGGAARSGPAGVAPAR